MKWNLRNRIAVPAIALVALVTATIGVAAFLISRAMLNHAMDAQLEQTCNTTVTQVEDWLDGQRKLLQVWANQPQTLTALGETPDAANARHDLCVSFTQAKDLYGCAEDTCLADHKGLVIASSNKGIIDKLSVAERPFFKGALPGQIAISDVLASRVTGKPMVAVGVPIKAGNTVRGVVFSALDLGMVSEKVISKVKVLETGYAYLYDGNGLMLAHPDKSTILKTKLDDQDWGRRMRQLRHGQLDYTFEGVSKRVVFRESDSLHWGIAITVPYSELNLPLHRLTIWIASIGVGALMIGVMLMFLTARSVSRPIQHATDALSGGAVQTAQAAGQVSHASQTLAEGASEQAASLEETSASLEEITSMTHRNAENSQQATDLAKQSHAAADRGVSDMQAMNIAMQAIKASSDDIVNIIKTIDRNRFPDQHPRSQRRGRGGARRRGRHGLCRRRRGSAQPGPPERRGRQRNRGQDRGRDRENRPGRGTQRQSRQNPR